MDVIRGFSRMSADDQLAVLQENQLIDENDLRLIRSFRHPDPAMADMIRKFTENVVGSYHLPFSIAPNFLINNNLTHVPMVVEESSVVAAASWSAQFWAQRGGFKTRVINREKTGQIHFSWKGSFAKILESATKLEQSMRHAAARITENMEKRGGGITRFEWLDLSKELPETFQCRVGFHTADSMGANFINSCLESMSHELVAQLSLLYQDDPEPEIIMSILSNYTPDCLVECTVEADVREFEQIRDVSDGSAFARKFKQAVDIALADPYRAVTHNKGIFNGMDAVILATANDFRAFEAGGHAWAAQSGRYRSLTECYILDGVFTYTLQVPAAVGTVGGLTSTHPLARLALKILGNPGADELMQIVAAAGMANNFSAIKALTTSGIQSGHMKMHLSKILMQLQATPKESRAASDWFAGKTVSYRDVADYLNRLRKTSE